MELNEYYKKQIKNCDLLIDKLSKESLNYNNFKEQLEHITKLNLNYETIQILGLDITIKKNKEIFLNSRNKAIKDEIFCVVDIESTDTISNGQIIEIGAVKLQNNEILDTFNSLIYAKEVPDNIKELTGINTQMLQNANKSTRVLSDFRLFLQNSVFVAHNVNFDYGFIAKESLQFLNAPLLNLRLCTISLAKKCIKTERYGLNSLKELLGINNLHHRALNDALSCAEIFKFCLDKIPSNIKTSMDLIKFAK